MVITKGSLRFILCALPFKCTKKIDDLGGNFAFWLFLIICTCEIFYIIGINILTLGSLKKVSFRKGLIHDELYYHIRRVENETDDEANSNDEHLSKPKEKSNIKTSRFEFENNDNDIAIDKFHKTFS